MRRCIQLCALALALLAVITLTACDRVQSLIHETENEGLDGPAFAELTQEMGPDAIGPLIDALSYDSERDDPRSRDVVVSALVAIGAPAVEPLIVALNRSDGIDKAAVAVALATIGESALVSLDQRGMEAEAAHWMVWALDPTYEGDAPNTSSHDAVVRALVAIGAPAAESLADALVDNGGTAVAEVLVMIGEPAAQALIARCTGEDVLRSIGPSAVGPLLAAAMSGDANARRFAAEVLYGSDDDPFPRGSSFSADDELSALTVLAEDSWSDTRAYAIDGVAWLYHRGLLPDEVGAVSQLLFPLLDDIDPDIKDRVAEELAGMSDDVLLALADVPSEVAIYTVDYYRLIAEGDPASLAALVAALLHGGAPDMAEDYANSGNSLLSRAAGLWADSNGYRFVLGHEAPSLTWGQGG